MAFPLHGRLLSALANFYPSRATIQENIPTQDAYGQPIALWGDLARHVNVPCTIAAVKAEEMRRPDSTLVTVSHHIALQGYYPTIVSEMRAIVDNIAWNILGVEHDSRLKTTRLKVELVQ